MNDKTDERYEDVEVGKVFRETKIAKVSMAVMDRSNLEMGEYRRKHQTRIKAGSLDASGLEDNEKDDDGEEDER